ncbi:MAG: DUF1059 domain-containing protein [Streptosporangiaceae bacterium]
MSRKIADCRGLGGTCTLMIAGEEEEVLAVALQHAVSAHRREDVIGMRAWLREHLRDEMPDPGPGGSLSMDVCYRAGTPR